MPSLKDVNNINQGQFTYLKTMWLLNMLNKYWRPNSVLMPIPNYDLSLLISVARLHWIRTIMKTYSIVITFLK